MFLLGLFAMTEWRLLRNNKGQDKWVRCPTCRQRTDVGNIAYVDDRQNESSNSSPLQTLQDNEKCEASIVVQGSYGTKVFFHLGFCNKLERPGNIPLDGYMLFTLFFICSFV